MTWKEIDPNTAMTINIVIGALGAIASYLATEGLPPPVSADVSNIVKAWAAWSTGAGAAVVGVFNVYLHAASSSQPGALAAQATRERHS